MTRYDAYIEKDWEKHGLAHLVVARVRPGGTADLAVLLVDTLCLGVKDAFFESGLGETELTDHLERNLPPENERVHPACAKKLVEGAVAYAQSLGFAPTRDFRKARKIFSGLDDGTCPQEFAFGRDGRPCFVRGPHDDDERTDRVLAILAARCGEDGYDFIDESGDDEDAAASHALAVRDELMEFLAAEPEEVPQFHRFSGIVTALLLSPAVPQPLKVCEAVWGPAGKAWADRESAQEFFDLLLAYWNQVNDLILDAIEPGAPAGAVVVDVFREDFAELAEDEGEKEAELALLTATVEWAHGFVRAVELWPEAWAGVLDRPDLAPHWDVIRWWGTFENEESRRHALAAAEAQPPRTLATATATTALARALRRPVARE